MKSRILATILLLAVSATLIVFLPAASSSSASTVPPPEGKIVYDSNALDNPQDPQEARDRDVWVANPDGTDPTNLTRLEGAGDVDAAFSRDATTIVFSSCRTDNTVVENIHCSLLAQASPNLADSNVHVMKSDGEGVTALTTTNQSPTNDGAADIFVSPDPEDPDVPPSKIAFVSFRDGNSEIYTMNLNGSNQTRLTRDELVAPIQDLGPVFSHDGSKIAFSRAGAIHVMQQIREDNNWTWTAPQRLTMGSSDHDPSWSPDGSKIAFSRGGSINIVDANCRISPTTICETPEVEGTAQTPSTVYNHPAWSPDGNWIAFSSNRGSVTGTTSDFEIWRVSVSGGAAQLIQVTNNTDDDRSPDWVENFKFNVTAASHQGGSSTPIPTNEVPASPGSIPLEDIPLQPGAPNGDQPATAPIKIEELGLAPIKIEELGLAPIKIEELGLSPIKIEELGLSGIKIEELGLTPIKIEELGLAAPAALLEGLRSLPLSSIPLIPPQSWEAILSEFTHEPVHNLSIADVLEMNPRPNLGGIEWKDIDLTQPPLGSLSFVSLLVGGTTIENIDGWIDSDTDIDGYVDTKVPASSYWCPRLEKLGYSNCAASAGGLKATPVDLQVAGVPFGGSFPLPLQAFALSGITLAEGAPLRSVAVNAFDTNTLIGSLELAKLPNVNKIVNCSLVDDCKSGTLRTADDAGAILPPGENGVGRFGALLGCDAATETCLGSGPAIDLTLGDIAFGLFGDYPIDAVPLNQLAIKWWGGDVSSKVVISGEIAQVGNDAPKSLKVTIPQSFVFDSASAWIEGSAAPRNLPEPSVSERRDAITWDLAEDLAAGEVTKFQIVGRPGLSLGTFDDDVAGVVTQEDAQGVTTETRSAPVTVTDTFEKHGTFNDNNSPASAAKIELDTMNVSFTPTAGDSDFYKVDVPAGAGVEVTLGHQTIDRDLIVYADKDSGLGKPLRAQDPEFNAGVEPVLPDESIGFDNSDTELQADLAMDIQLEDLPVAGISQQRENGTEFVRAKGGGTLTIQVAPYFGASAPEPYSLVVRLTSQLALGPCQEPALRHVSEKFGHMPDSIPSDTTTLVLLNENRMRRALGDEAAGSVVSKLKLLDGHALGQGLELLSVDDPRLQGVVDAYAAWDANLCDPSKSNAVVRAINDSVDALLAKSGAGASIKHVMIVGDHRVIPAGGVADLTRWGYEASFAQSLAHSYRPVSNNFEISSAAAGLIGSDNPFGDPDPTSIVGGYSYRPDWSVGRLVESGEQITRALDRYMASGGELDPKTAATFGTDFMKDAAKQIDSAIEARLGAPQFDRADDTWTLSDLNNAVTGSARKDIVSLNAHFDEAHALPPGSPGSLFNTTHVANEPGGVGSIWFTMGCHSGLSAAGTSDWADALSGKDFNRDGVADTGVDIFVGQSGYGLGSRSSVALSELILTDFAKNLMSGMPAGLALTEAKKSFLASNGVMGVYEEKALQEATLYGIPMYRIRGTVPPAPPAGDRQTTTDSGLQAATYTVTPQFQLVENRDGSKFYLASGKGHGPQNRPIIPYVQLDVSKPGLEARGWTLEAAATFDQTNFRVATSKALLTGSEVSPPSSPFEFVNSPAVQARISEGQKLLFNAGKFSGDPVKGDMRRFLSATLRVYYSDPLSPFWSDRTPPTFLAAGVNPSASSASFFADVTDNAGAGSVKKVTVLYRDKSGTWKSGQLERAGDTRWELNNVAFSGPNVEAMFFAVDAGGNSAVTTAKATNFGDAPAPSRTYFFEGFFPPDSTLNAGQTNPIKFRLFHRNADGSKGAQITDVRAIKAIWSSPTDCTSGIPSASARKEDLTKLKYSTSDRFFIFNWQSDKAWAGGCQTLQVDTDDGGIYTAQYTFK